MQNAEAPVSQDQDSRQKRCTPARRILMQGLEPARNAHSPRRDLRFSYWVRITHPHPSEKSLCHYLSLEAAVPVRAMACRSVSYAARAKRRFFKK